MQKYLHLLQIVETEKTVAKQLRRQIEDGETEIERLKAEVTTSWAPAPTTGSWRGGAWGHVMGREGWCTVRWAFKSHLCPQTLCLSSSVGEMGFLSSRGKAVRLVRADGRAAERLPGATLTQQGCGAPEGRGPGRGSRQLSRGRAVVRLSPLGP